MICKKCGTKMEMERDKVYTSNPPQYGFKCPKCGAFEFSTTPEYDDEQPGAEYVSPIEKTIEAWQKMGEYLRKIHMQFMNGKESPTSDALTEKEVYDYYQERSVKAGDRADQLAWMFIIMAAGVLFSGHTWQSFLVCATLATIYMLLSVLQAVWQTFTSWLFKQRIKKMDVAPKDYPSWIGGGAWLFFWAKMIAIASAVIYFAKIVFF